MPYSVKVRMNNGRWFRCEVDDWYTTSSCRYCGCDIVWGKTQRGKAIPLEPELIDDGWADSHFAHCDRDDDDEPRRQRSTREDEYRRGYETGYSAGKRATEPDPGRQADDMTATMWRKLVSLVHPDRHHGGATEATANEVTQWLLDHRPPKG